MYGGSVNQKITLYVNDLPNVFIISGFNVPLLLELILSNKEFSEAYIERMINKAKEEIILVKKQELINDEDFF